MIAISQSLKQDLMFVHRLSLDRVTVVYNGIGKEYLDLYLRKEPMLQNRALYVGRLHFRKGILKVLEEFARRRDIDVEFVLAGDGPDRLAIERLASEDHRIVYLSSVDRSRLISLLSTSQVFIFPTYYEGFTSALLEAMAAGLCCLSYESAITREMFGDAGVMVPLGQAEALVEQLGQAVEDPAQMRWYGKVAHERAKQFSWERCAREISLVLHQQLGIEPARVGA